MKATGLSCLRKSRSLIKATITTKKVKIAIFMPIEVFADFFHDEEVRTTPTMFICKSKKAVDFLDDGWDKMQTGRVLSDL